METYNFYCIYADQTTKYEMPRIDKIEANSLEAAIAEFCRRHKVKEDSRERDTVWFVSKVDGMVFQYSIS